MKPISYRQIDIGKATRGDIEVAAGLVVALSLFFLGFFMASPKALKS